MWLYYGAVLLVVVSNVLYHIAAKSTPTNINPIVSLIITYFTAAVFCLLMLPFYPNSEGIAASLKKINWASFALGITVVGLELGFLLAYKAGWNISLAQLCSNVLVSILLIPIGLMFFQDKLTLVNIVGIVLCFGGFILVSYK